MVISVAHVGDSEKEVTIVQDEKPMAKIVVGQEAGTQVTEAAKTLSYYIEEASGAKLEVMTDNEMVDYKGVTVQIGETAFSVNKDIIPEGLDDDGFVIYAKDNEVIISGPTLWGTEFGVYDFLERYVGVRWLLPGSDGDDVPTMKTIAIPQGIVKEEPAAFSRLFSGLRGSWQAKWARFNRMRGRVRFHHNLLNVFPPETYTKTHPEFFPMKDGETRFLPPTNNTHGWQPCFLAKGSVEEAVKNIIQYFNEHPEETSYSLGVNDSSGHCRCPLCIARLSREENFLGRMDYSDLYYDWCNKVIEGVLNVFPDKWFGCLAYSEVASAPKKVKVHERMIPYLTYDRMKWIHPEVKAAGHKVTEAWEKISPNLGWYDYIYGTPYCLPRVYFHQTAEYLRYGHEHGVRTHYAEIYPNFGEGPKPYIYLKLWWNPKQNVDALLKEWYERCVGSESAPYLEKYYAMWERFWTEDILESKWFSVSGQYLRFSAPDYLADVKEEDILESRRLLDTCINKCKTEKQRARAKLLEKAFQYYEASVLAYLTDKQAETVTINTESEALEALSYAERAMRMAQKRRYLALEVYPKDPVLLNPLNIDRYVALSGESWGGNGIWAVMDWVSKGDNAVRKKMEELAQESDCENVRCQLQLMLAIADKKVKPISRNPSFEQGEGTASADWTYWVKPAPNTGKPVGRMLKVENQSHTGKASLLCDSMYRGGPVQSIMDFQEGKYCGLAWVYVPEGQVSKGTTELSITPRDKQGNNLPGFSTKIVPRPGRWSLIVASGRIPKEIEGKEVHHIMIIPIVDGFQDGGKVYWDDVALYRIEDGEN